MRRQWQKEASAPGAKTKEAGGVFKEKISILIMKIIHGMSCGPYRLGGQGRNDLLRQVRADARHFLQIVHRGFPDAG